MAGLVSTTVRVMCSQQPFGWKEAMEEFAQYGEIARMDVSLSGLFGSVLVTFYDCRSVAHILRACAGRTELIPGQAHDFRAVKVNMKMVGEKLDTSGGFSAFGEVANCSLDGGDVVVEFFDMRAAQSLLALVGTAGSPSVPMSQKMTSQTDMASMVGLPAAPGLQSPMANPAMLMSSLNAMTTMDANPQMSAMNLNMGALAPDFQALAQALQEVTELAQIAPAPAFAPTLAQNAEWKVEEHKKEQKKEQKKEEKQATGQSSRVVRTKVTNKEFSMYDIDTDKIQSGEDTRTTVMVRNLTGTDARKDFLNFLVICGLSDRYTFFYMPYKEHRNVLAGFAFINLVAPKDVQVLYTMLKDDVWRKVYRSPNAKASTVPAVSYARFQGHAALVSHFSSSAVLHEQDPEKRPIFRPQAGQQTEHVEAKTKKAAQAPKKAKEGVVATAEDSKKQPKFVPLPRKVKLGAPDSPIGLPMRSILESEVNVDDPVNGWSAGA